MKICLIQLAEKHTEIAGYFMQKFKNHELFVLHPKHKKSKYNCFDYYSKVLNKKITYIRGLHEPSYDKIILLSSDELFLFQFKNKKKIILIAHVPNMIKPHYTNICLTPLITGINNYLPIYKTSNTKERENIFSVIGLVYHEQKNVNDLKYIINESKKYNYRINIYTRKYDINQGLLKELDQHENVTLRIDIPSENLINEVRRTKFICVLDKPGTWYHKDRLTGSIPLGLNNNIPLIISAKLNDIYGLTGMIVYNNSVTEVFDKIMKYTDVHYDNILANVNKCRDGLLTKKIDL
jgi:hypothetical protein